MCLVVFYGTSNHSLLFNTESCLYVYTPEQKYKTTLKDEEKDIVYNF